jgi:hypothetical protein
VSKIATAIYNTYDGGQVGQALEWPERLSETTDGTVTFPSGTAATTVPSDQIVSYDVSTDGKYFDVGVSGGARNEIAIYDSQSNTYTWMCASGAPTSCPAGGVSPGSGDDGTTTSNS